MARFDRADLRAPLADDDPCGSDLDLEEDDQFMNFTVEAETVLPGTYFVEGEKDTRIPFDQTPLYRDGVLTTMGGKIESLFDRTRDLRLFALMAKITLLGKDVEGFEIYLEATAVELEQHWEAVHPRGESDGFALRKQALMRFDDPLFKTALEYVPLFSTRRFGTFTFQRFGRELRQTAQGEAEPDAAAFDRLVVEENAADLGLIASIRDSIAESHERFVRLAGIVARIVAATRAHLGHEAPDLQVLAGAIGAIERLLDRLYRLGDAALGRTNPALMRRPAEDPVPAGPAVPDPAAEAATPSALPVLATGAGAFADARAAAAGLARAGDYFRRREPSNPAALLIQQAQALIGKSFVEAMQILLPEQVDHAALALGGGAMRFRLPLTRLAPGEEGGEPPAEDSVVEDGAEPVPIGSRAEAIAMLDRVGSYFRQAEPSSPVPLLTERARTLAGKDFMSLLADVLPREEAASRSDW